MFLLPQVQERKYGIQILLNHTPYSIPTPVSLLLCKNFPKAWNRDNASSLPKCNEYPESDVSGLLLSSFNETWEEVEEAKECTRFGFRQKNCKEVIACLMSPPLVFAIRSTYSAVTSHRSIWHILKRTFFIEFTVIGLKATWKFPKLSLTHIFSYNMAIKTRR